MKYQTIVILEAGDFKMGEYVGINIRNFDYISSKNSFGDLLLFFSEDDLKIEEVEYEGEKYTKRYFSTTVSRAKMCLDCLGHTVLSARKDFEKGKKEELEYVEYCMEDDPSYEAKYNEIKENFTFEEWVSAVKKFALILANDYYDSTISGYKNLELERTKPLTTTERIVIDSLPYPWHGEFFGLNHEDICVWNVFRIILDAFPSDEIIELDYTNLYEGGWCNEVPEDIDYSYQKTIILTEGKFDVEVLEKSLKLLYPFMRKFYSFMNFSEYKIQGSTNFLTHYFKAFIASGITNRVIALYDNDSAGCEEVLNLSSIVLPDNFKIMKLPEIELAKGYPTLGPTGEDLMDINGKACSIELFLGKDVLNDNGNLSPVHWKGYNEKTKTYQGEIMNKTAIQNKFREKVKNSVHIEREDWKEMKQLLQAIFMVFMENQTT